MELYRSIVKLEQDNAEGIQVVVPPNSFDEHTRTIFE